MSMCGCVVCKGGSMCVCVCCVQGGGESMRVYGEEEESVLCHARKNYTHFTPYLYVIPIL